MRAKQQTEHSTGKSRKVLIVLGLAVVFMLLAGVGVYQLLTPQRTTIFLFNKDYAAGTQLTRDMLTAIQVDSHVVDGGLRQSTGDYFITGNNYNAVLQSAGILRADVHGGNVLTTSALSTTGGNAIEMNMRQNAIAVTVGVNDISGVTGDLAYGSRVNVYASYNAETILLLQNIRVLKTTHSSSGLSSATLELDHEQSLEVIHAQTYGTVHLGLVDANGYMFTTNDKPTYTLAGYTVTAEINRTQPDSYTPRGAGETEEETGNESEQENAN